MQSAGSYFVRRNTAAQGVRQRRLLTFFCLFVFLFQTYIAQTHIHIPGSDDGIFAAQAVAGSVTQPGPAPDQTPQDDIAKCPFCQVAMAVGTLIGPSALYLILPATDGIVVAIRELKQPDRTAMSHAWQSRGPPEH